MKLIEVITKSERDIVERALEILKKHKGINFSCESFDLNPIVSPTDNSDVIVLDATTGRYYHCVFSSDIFKNPRMENESKTLPFDDIVALRIARFIFETYKAERQKELASAVNNTLNSSLNQTISSIKYGNATYDIGVNGRSLTATFSELDEAREKIDDLEKRNAVLEQQLLDLQALLMAKGVI